ncbi:MAG: hypothetical protein JNK87_41700 [Bryobacterales bacterium]|nr:hypothetical protein [Bryobacterales bacterium]
MDENRKEVFGEVDHLLAQARNGDAQAMDRVWSLMQPHLKQIARALMRRERHRTNFGTTGSGLISELWLRLVPNCNEVASAEHLLALARRAMRRILIDNARVHRANKRDHIRTPFEEALHKAGMDDRNLEAIFDGLDALEKEFPQPAQAFELYFIDRATQLEGAEIMGIDRHAFQRMLTMAIAYIREKCADD